MFLKKLVQEPVVFFGTRLRSNSRGYLREFAPYLVLVFVAALLDFISTYRYMSAWGVDLEMHPVIRWVSYLFGPLLGPLIGKMGQLMVIILLTLLFRQRARWIFIPVIAL